MTGTPMIDDIAAARCPAHSPGERPGLLTQRVAGLEGTLHQRLGRRSHRVELAGMLIAETAADDLKTLQQKAQSGRGGDVRR